MLEHFFNSSPVAMALLDPKGRWLQINPALCALLDAPPELLARRSWLAWIHPDDREAACAYWHAVQSGENPVFDGELRLIQSRGQTFWASLELFLVEKNGVRNLGLQLKNVQAQRDEQNSRESELNGSCSKKIAELKAQIETLRVTDLCTEFANARAFAREIQDEINRSRRYANRFSLLLLHIESYAALRSSHGPQAAENLMGQIASVIRPRLRRTDLPGRISSNKIAVLTINTGAEGALVLGRGLSATLQKHAFESLEALQLQCAIVEFHEGDDLLRMWQRLEEVLVQAWERGQIVVSE